MKRDITLDIVKGVACLLMILAHPKTLHLTVDTDLTTFFWYVGFFAPVVFFASVGVSLRYQLNKRTKLQISLNNLLLITFVYISQNFNFDSLFTALTLSTVMAVYLLKWNSAFLIIGVSTIDELLNYFAVSVRHFHGTLFSLIPWVGFIFLGDYLQKEKKMRLPVFILASAAALYLKLAGAAVTGQSPTPIFIALGIAIYSFVVLISPYLSKIPNVSGFLVFLGKNTLLFWWVHFFLLKTIFAKLGRMYAPYTWVLLLFTSAVVILMLNKLNKLTFAMNYHNFLPAVTRIGAWDTDRAIAC